MGKDKINKSKGIGVEVNPPKDKCDDQHCPFHSHHKVRGRIFEGKIVRLSSQKTGMIEWDRLYLLPKYERFEKRRTRLKVHVPPCIKLNIGDIVKIMESRPISKTKNFIVVEKVSKK